MICPLKPKLQCAATPLLIHQSRCISCPGCDEEEEHEPLIKAEEGPDYSHYIDPWEVEA